MRFRFLKPRKDVASPEQVRALRERRGWTAEQLADRVHASALEVSAWEAGAVAVPANQALRIRWMEDLDAWKAALDAAGGQSCAWAGEHAPDLYGQMFRNPAGSWYTRDALVRAHLAGCDRCNDVWKEAKRIGRCPRRPDLSGSLRARYWRWVDRLPPRARAPFEWAGLLAVFFPGMVGIGLLVLTADREPGFWTHANGLLVGVVFGVFAELLPIIALSRVPRAPITPLLRGFAFGAGGLLGWSLVDPSIHLGDPRHWAAAVTAGCGIQLLQWVAGRLWTRRKAKKLAAGIAPRPALSAASPDLAVGLERGAPASRQPARP